MTWLEQKRRDEYARVVALATRLARITRTEPDPALAVTALVNLAVAETQRVKGCSLDEAKQLVIKIIAFEEKAS